MKYAVVTTTINRPVVLEKYCENFRKYGHEPSVVKFIVIGDKKTPSDVGQYLRQLMEASGYEIEYWDEARQADYLQNHRKLMRLLVWNSIQRRNLGFFLAWRCEAEIVISIDDDNHIEDGDYLGDHGIVGTSLSLPAAESSTGWFNVCDLAKTHNGARVYHRGFPVRKRWGTESIVWGQRIGRCVINAGLWLGEPDADAMTHIVAKAEITGYEETALPHFALHSNTWCPFNSQNTAYSRDLIPALYLITMGSTVDGLRFGRYDDIFQSYFIQKIAQTRGDLICYGSPIVRQIRNPHNYLKDLKEEVPGMELTNLLVDTLSSITLAVDGYLESYQQLARALRSAVESSGDYTESQKAFVLNMCNDMLAWSDLFRPVAASF